MMTENQWTTSGQTSPEDINADFGTTPAAAASAESGSVSKKDAAKEEASNVAGQAAEAAQGVAQTAKEEAAHVVSEAKSSAQDLLSQAKSGFSSQAGTQQQKAAEGIRTISSQLQSMADAPDQQGVARDLIRQAAQRSESVASWLENKQPGDLLGEVQRFARNKPGTFLLLAAGAGVLAGRLTRGLTAGTSGTSSTSGNMGTAGTAGLSGQYSSPYGDQYTEGYTPAGGTVPPPPAQLPGPGTTTAGYDGGAPGTSYPDAARPASPLDSPQLVEEEPWSGTRTAEDPLGDPRLAADPLDDDPLARDRRAGGQSGGL